MMGECEIVTLNGEGAGAVQDGKTGRCGRGMNVVYYESRNV